MARPRWQAAPPDATPFLKKGRSGKYVTVEQEGRVYPLGYFDSEENAVRFERDFLAWCRGERSRPASNDTIYGEVVMRPISVP